MGTYDCPKCGTKLQPEDTAIFNMKKARAGYQQKKYCCPRCDTILSVEISPCEKQQDEGDAAPAHAAPSARGVSKTPA